MQILLKIILLLTLILEGGFHVFGQTYQLEQCIDIAIKKHPDLKDAAIGMEMASAVKAEAVSNFVPSLQLNLFQSGNFGRSIDRFTNNYIDQFYNATYAGAGFSMPIFNGFANKYSLAAANKSIQAAATTHHGNKNQLGLQVTSAYLEVLAAKEMVKAMESLLVGDSSQLALVEARVEAGLGTRTEQLQIMNQLKTDEMSHGDAVMAYESTIIRLFQLLGLEPSLEATFEDVNFSVENLPSQLQAADLLQLPEVRRFDLMAESQMLNAKSVSAQRFPRISLSGEYGTFYASSNPERNFGQQLNDTRNGSVSIGLQWSILSFIRVNASTRQAKANVETTLNAKERYVLGLSTELSTALSRYKALTVKYDRALTLKNLSTETLDNIRRQIESGTIGISDLLLAQSNLERATTNHIRAKYELLLQQKVLKYYADSPQNLH